MTRLHNWVNPARIQQEPPFTFRAKAVPEWIAQAKCAGQNPEDFFPGKGDTQLARKTAQEVCSDCPVSQQCLQWALDNEDFHGVYGGTTPNDRRVLLGRPTNGRVA